MAMFSPEIDQVAVCEATTDRISALVMCHICNVTVRIKTPQTRQYNFDIFA